MKAIWVTKNHGAMHLVEGDGVQKFNLCGSYDAAQRIEGGFVCLRRRFVAVAMLPRIPESCKKEIEAQ